jgi:hypothetical protein
MPSRDRSDGSAATTKDQVNQDSNRQSERQIRKKGPSDVPHSDTVMLEKCKSIWQMFQIF